MKKPFNAITQNLWVPAIILAVISIGWSHGQKKPTATTNTPKLINACLFTNDVDRLVKFYEPVLKIKASRPDETYAEFSTGVGVLAIFSHKAEEKYIPGSITSQTNGNMVLEFKVADADAEYKRLQGMVKIWVKPPTTQPWGSRSVYFRDPDGNLADFYTILKTK